MTMQNKKEAHLLSHWHFECKQIAFKSDLKLNLLLSKVEFKVKMRGKEEGAQSLKHFNQDNIIVYL